MMMETMTTDGEAARKRKRRKTEQLEEEEKKKRPLTPTRWRTEAEHQMYSSKLIEALRQVRRDSPVAPPRNRAVREAADRALAVAAKGRTHWSRAILLTSRRRRLLKASRRRRPKKKPFPVPPLPAQPHLLKKSSGGALSPLLQRKVKVLGRLVPGCRKLSFPALLDETSDYIAALQMQIRAMIAVAEALSAAGISGLAAVPPPLPPLLSGQFGSTPPS